MSLALAGCSPPGPPQPASADGASPVVRGAESGLHLKWWVLADDGEIVARALLPYLDRPVPLSDDERRLWRANGLRVIAVPVGEVERVEARLRELRAGAAKAELDRAGAAAGDLARLSRAMPTLNMVQEQWLGEAPRWIDAVRGPLLGARGGRIALALDNGPLVLGPGRLRLLVRCWRVPVEGGEGPRSALRVDLAPQFEEQHASGDDFLRRRPLAVEEDGLVFSRLVVETVLDGSEALVIVPDRPDADWGSLDAPAAGPAQRGYGPPEPDGVTIGEAMLSSAGGAGSDRPVAKAVIVLTPRVRGRFDLAGR